MKCLVQPVKSFLYVREIPCLKNHYSIRFEPVAEMRELLYGIMEVTQNVAMVNDIKLFFRACLLQRFRDTWNVESPCNEFRFKWIQ